MSKPRLALHGYQFGGKSELAKALEELGFGYVNYTQLLKKYALLALAALGIDATLDDLEGPEKEKYRNFVIETGTVIGFDQGFGIDESVIPAIQASGIEAVVFDNVRFPAQMDKLLPHGFRLVRIVTPLETRLERAVAKGYTRAGYLKALEKITETPLPEYPGEIQIVVDGPMEDVLKDLFTKIEGRLAA